MNHQRLNAKSNSAQSNHDDWDETHRQMLEVQKKSMVISNPGDADEEEADTVARKVMNGESATISGSSGRINRRGEGSVESSPEFQSQLQNSKGSGRSLPASLQQEMGSKMGADFSDVKVHTGNQAAMMSDSINAKAFTSGNDIYFNQGQYDTQSKHGQELIAHELTHTIQQKKASAPELIQRTPKEEFDVYVAYKETLHQRNIVGKSGKELDDLNAAHEKFKAKAKKFSESMDEDNGTGWTSQKYNKKLRNKFNDYDQRIGEKKEEVHNEITATIDLLNSSLEGVPNLIKLAISTSKLKTPDAESLLKKAKGSLENARAGRIMAESFLSGADEIRLLAEYDDIITKYGTLITEIEQNIAGHAGDVTAFEKISTDLEDQKKKLAEFKLLADGTDDVVTLIKLQTGQLVEIKTSIDNSISSINARAVTPGINKTDMPGRLTALEKRADTNLADEAITKEVNALTKTERPERVPVLAQLIHNQLISTIPDKQIILVNLQKLSGDTEINAFKKFYIDHYETEIKDDLTLKLAGLDLQLALEFLKMEATVGQVNMIGTKPTNDAQRDALADRIHTALYKVPVEVPTVFACLVPFNRNKAAIDLLKTKYSSRHGVELEADIKAKIVDDNDESYAIYLLNAPIPTAEFHGAKPVTNEGSVQDQKEILGGTVTEKKDVNFTSGAGLQRGGHSFDYTGVLIPDTRWMQFIWWEIELWTGLTSPGVGDPTTYSKLQNTAPALPIDMGGQEVFLTLDPAAPTWYVDSLSPTDPFVDHTSHSAMRNSISTRDYDKPSSVQGFVNALRTHNGAKLVRVTSHLEAYLIRDFLPLIKDEITVAYTHTTTTDPNVPVITAKLSNVDRLDSDVKDALKNDTRYQGKFSYIR